jgi:4-methylaminobutanoate oxidase (formaldehyde-forming)
MAPARLATSLPEIELRELCRLQYAHHYWSPETMPDEGQKRLAV